MKYEYIGKNVLRCDGIDKVTGRGKFIADIKISNCLKISIIRSKCPHAIIKKIEIKKAFIQGVYAIVTGKGGYVTREGKITFCKNKKEYLVGSCIKD